MHPPPRTEAESNRHYAPNERRKDCLYMFISCYQNWHVLKSQQRSNVTKPPKSFGDIIVLPGNGEAKLIELNMLPGELD